MKRRILHIIPTLDRAGAEKQLALLASNLPPNEFEIHVCALTRGGPMKKYLDESGIPVTMIGKHFKIDPLAYWRLERLIRRLRPDLVHTWIFAANAYGRQAALRSGVEHIVASERCVDPWKRSHQLAIDRYLAGRSSAIVVPSPGIRDFYAARGLPQDKFHIIPNGVPASDGKGSVARGALLAELNLPPQTRLIGAVGRLWPQKRLKDAIWAAELISAVRGDSHLLIIGEGPLRWRLERFCRFVHVGNQIHFLGHRDDVTRIMPHLDCLWLSSDYEGMPNAILEAMASAVPVVATDISGNRDLVVHGETGFLVPVGDRAGLARLTNELLDDDPLRARLGQAGRARATGHFSVARMVQGHATLYRQIMD